MIALSYGGGTDSTALLLAAHARGIRPDLIVFADTGSERPETYAYLDTIGAWLASVGWPPVLVVRWIRQDGRFVALHEQCEQRQELPSAAYGFAGCTSKWKQQPLDAAILAHPETVAAHARGEPVERWVGYSADEDHRVGRLVGKPDPHLWRWRAPLYEWGIDRAEARDLIAAAGLPQPGKSSCWLCPHTRRSEVQDLARKHPELYARAVAIERNAKLDSIAGLGRRWAWEGIERQEQLFPDPPEIPCGCADLRVERVRPHRRSRPYAARPARLDPWRGVLGLWPDLEIARAAGVTRATVAKMRARSEGSGARSLL